MESDKIFVGCSCRYGTMVPNGSNYHWCLHHTHNTKEFIQYISYIKNDIDIPTDIQSKVFRLQWLHARDNEPLEDIDRQKLLDEYNTAELVIAEICSRKIYSQDDYYIHHLASGKGDNLFNSESDSDDYTYQTDNDLKNDLIYIKKLTSDKKLLICSHINITKHHKRQNLIDSLARICHEVDINFFDTSKIISEKHCKDANHLNEYGRVQLKKCVSKHIKLL